jgi:isocitrate lyase
MQVGNEEATYLLTKKMIEAGACAIQIENQVSDAKNVVIKMESYCAA